MRSPYLYPKVKVQISIPLFVNSDLTLEEYFLIEFSVFGDYWAHLSLLEQFFMIHLKGFQEVCILSHFPGLLQYVLFRQVFPLQIFYPPIFSAPDHTIWQKLNVGFEHFCCKFELLWFFSPPWLILNMIAELPLYHITFSFILWLVRKIMT